MARERDEGKREAILAAAKRLFAEHGFHASSVAEVAAAARLPVGTVYTYFKNKEDLIACIIEEGWGGFRDELEAACAAEPSARARLALLTDRFLPALFDDTELISILLADGVRYTDLGAKLDGLAELVARVVGGASAELGRPSPLSRDEARVALCVFLLGGLDTIRLAEKAGLPIRAPDVLAFMRKTALESFRPAGA